MTVRQLASDYNGKKSVKTITVDNMTTNEKSIISIYDGHVYSSLKRQLSYDDFHSEVICHGRISPRSANIDVYIKKKENLHAYI